MTTPPPTDFDYAAAWSSVEEQLKDGLPKSAIAEIQSILKMAKSEKNEIQIVKAISSLSTQTALLGDNDPLDGIQIVEEEISSLDGIARHLLESFLADQYLFYYQMNQYKINQRTNIVSQKSSDIREWSSIDFYNKIHLLYQSSLLNPETLMVPIDAYKDFLNEYSQLGADLRPNLYLIVAYKAMDYYSSNSIPLTQTFTPFQLNTKNYYADSKTFTSLPIPTDSMDMAAQASLLYQRIEKNLSSTKNKEALAFAELLRVQYVHRNASMAENDKHFEAAIERIISYDTPHASAEALFLRAQRLRQENPKKAHDLAAKLIDKFPGSIAKKKAERLIGEIESPVLDIQAERTLIPRQSSPILITYKNLNQVFFRILKVSDEERKQINNLRYEERYERIRSLKPRESWTKSLPSTSDFRSLKYESSLKGLEKGHYILVASNTTKMEKGDAFYYTFLQVSNLALMELDADNTNLMVVVDRTSGQAIPEAEVQLFERYYNQRTRQRDLRQVQIGKTDAQGMLEVVNIDKSLVAKIRKGDDYYTNEQGIYFNRNFSENNPTFVELFTDRAIYRPGQIVHYKGLLLKSKGRDKKVLQDKRLKVTLYDANGQNIGEERVISNQYGSFSGVFTLPNQGLNGRFRIQVTGSDLSYAANSYVRVEEYKRPKFEVTILPQTTALKLGDKVTIEGQAMAFSGANISDASVQYKVIRREEHPWWRRSWYPIRSGQSQMIAAGNLSTDESGDFQFTFEAKYDEYAKGSTYYSYAIEVDVKDINGETRSANESYALGQKAINLYTSLPKQSDRSSFKEIPLIAQNFNGSNQSINGQLRIQKLKEGDEYISRRLWSNPELSDIQSFEQFHIGEPGTSDYDTWKVEKEIVSSPFQTQVEGENNFNIPSLEAGVYRVILSSPLADTFQTHIVVSDFENGQFSSAELLFNKTDKDSYNPGEQARVSFGSKDSLFVFYAVSQSKNTTGKWLPISNGVNHQLIDIKEADRGGIWVHVQYVKNNRYYSEQMRIPVPWTNKDLKVTLETFRDKMLPGSEETWKIHIQGPKNELLATELLASMYDISLDQFAKHGWEKAFYSSTSNRVRIKGYDFTATRLSSINYQWNRDTYESISTLILPQLIWYEPISARYVGRRNKGRTVEMMNAAPMEEAESREMEADDVMIEESGAPSTKERLQEKEVSEVSKSTQLTPLKLRSDFSETVFFYPHLSTNKNGDVIFSFKMSEALTTWKLLLLAHTPDLKYAFTSHEFTTQKDLMISGLNPRFLRSGDNITIAGKINNLSDQVLSGKSKIEFFDGLTMNNITKLITKGNTEIDFSVDPGAAIVVEWPIQIPTSLNHPILYQISAETEEHSDGEEHVLAVLSNRMLVTETMPMHVKGKEQKNFQFSSLKENKSPTLSQQNYSIEFTSNPSWYALQALPYLGENSRENSDNIINRYFAYAIGSQLVNTSPKIKTIFDQWKEGDSKALLSNLDKNEELKSTILSETPWIREAANEAEQKRRIALFFDLNKMSMDKKSAWDKLAQRQQSNGGFPWFPEGRDNIYTTQYILEQIGRMKKLGVLGNMPGIDQVIQKALQYADARLNERYEKMKWRKTFDPKLNHLDRLSIQYLFLQQLFDRRDRGEAEEAFAFYQTQIEQYWLSRSYYEQALIGQFAQWKENSNLVNKISASLLENAVDDQEIGMYWANSGYHWNQLPIERQSEMISFFQQLNQKEVVEKLCIWLLKNKQTNRWPTHKSTAAAVYSLLTANVSEEAVQTKLNPWLVENKSVEVSVEGKEIFDNTKEAGTLYDKVSYSKDEIQSELADISVRNPNEQIAWGAAYWQYFEDLDKIKSFNETPLKLRKEYYLKKTGKRGDQLELVKENQILATGDRLVARLFIETDRPMEFIHLKDMRASGVEPIDVLSGHSYSGGLGYYKSTSDASTDFYIDYLAKGSYVLEYDVWVSHKGHFSNGISSIQCLYAPEFASHSAGMQLKVE
jgi:uncharacterized protein YfaS (alpha-2-macroglobulin family)